MTAMVVLAGTLAPTVSRWLQAASTLPVPLAMLEVCVTREGLPSKIVLKARGAAWQTALLNNAPQTAPPNVPPDAPPIAELATAMPVDASSAPPTGHPIDHCPFCLLQGDGHALPPTPCAPGLAVVAPRGGVPPLFLHAPRPLHAWAAAPARAPPVLS